uniref:Regulator of microtubule dynamics protein 1 n=1 Tax=Clastoptera arizonana TaxID=38151 RepID=A0A1B6DGK8_9HEMI
MNSDLVRARGLIAVAVGAGVIIGAAGVYIFQQIFGDRRRLILQQDLYQLGLSVSDIRKEMENIRSVENKIRKRGRLRNQLTSTSSVVTDADIEMFSTVGTDDLDDEFYDLSSDENVLEQENISTDDFTNIDPLFDTDLEGKSKALSMLEDLLSKDKNANILWRLSKICHSVATEYESQGNDSKKEEYIFKGVGYGKEAIEFDSNCSNSHKWYAICVGARGQFQGLKEKIQDGYVFKKHVEIAIQINSEDPTLHHLLGRFKYEVATLSWIERRVAKMFGEIPEASFDEAIASLMKAEELNQSQWKENKLLVAKCYIGKSDYKKALKWLDKALEVASTTPQDARMDKDIETLLRKYHTYRIVE